MLLMLVRLTLHHLVHPRLAAGDVEVAVVSEALLAHQGTAAARPGGPARHNPRQQITLFAVAELLLAPLRVGQADHAAFVVVLLLPQLVAGCGQPG